MDSRSASDEEDMSMDYNPNIPIPQHITPATPDDSDDSDGDMKSLFNIMAPHHVPGKHIPKKYLPLGASVTEKTSVTVKTKTESFDLLTMDDDTQMQTDDTDEKQGTTVAYDVLDTAKSNEKDTVSYCLSVEDITLVSLESKEKLGTENIVGRNDLETLIGEKYNEAVLKNSITISEDKESINKNVTQDDEDQFVENTKENNSKNMFSNDDNKIQLEDSKSDLEIGNVLENDQEKLQAKNIAKDFLSVHEDEQEALKRSINEKTEYELGGIRIEKEMILEKEQTVKEETLQSNDKDLPEMDVENTSPSFITAIRNKDISLDDAMDIMESENQTESDRYNEIQESVSVETQKRLDIDNILVTDSMMADISMRRSPGVDTIHDSSSLDFSIIVKTDSMYKVGEVEANITESIDNKLDQTTKDTKTNIEQTRNESSSNDTFENIESNNSNTGKEESPRDIIEVHSDSEDDEFESADEGERKDEVVEKGYTLEGSLIVIHDDDSEDESDKFKTSFSGLTGPKLEDIINCSNNETNTRLDDRQGTIDKENRSSNFETAVGYVDSRTTSVSSRASSCASIIILGSSVRGQYNSISSQLPDENLSDSVIIVDDKEETKVTDKHTENTGSVSPEESDNSHTAYHNDFEAGEQGASFSLMNTNNISLKIKSDDEANDRIDGITDISNQPVPSTEEENPLQVPKNSLAVYQSIEGDKLSSKDNETHTDDVGQVRINEELSSPNQNEPLVKMDVPPPVPPKSMAVYESMANEKSEKPNLPKKDYPSLESRHSMESIPKSFNEAFPREQNRAPSPELGNPDYQNNPPHFNAGPQQPQQGYPYGTQQQYPPYFYPPYNQPMTAEQQQQYSMMMYYWQMAHQFQQYNQAMPTAPPHADYASYYGGQSWETSYQGPQNWQQLDGEQLRDSSTTSDTAKGHPQQTNQSQPQDVKNQEHGNTKTGETNQINKGRAKEAETNMKKTERKAVSEVTHMPSRSNTNFRAPERPNQRIKDHGNSKRDDRNMVYERGSHTADSKRGTAMKDSRRHVVNEGKGDARPKSNNTRPTPAPRKKHTNEVPRKDQRDFAKPKTDEVKPKSATEKKNEPTELVRNEWYLLVKDLHQNASLENLINYLEIGLDEGQHVIAEKVVYDKENGHAVVVFSDKPDTEKLYHKIANRVFEGGHLSCCEISAPTHIAFSCEESIRNPESLENYFEIPRNDGGAVTDPVKESEDGSCHIIGFEDTKVVERLCTRPQPHRFDNKVLRVTPCYTFEGGAIWDHNIHTIPKAEPVEVNPPPEHLRYLKRCCFKELQTQVEDKNGCIVVDSNSVKITCTLTPKFPGFKTLIRAWPEDMRALVDKFIEENICQRSVSLDNEMEVWSRLLSSVPLIDEVDLNIVQIHDNCELLFTGHPEKVGQKYTETTKEIEAIRRKLRRTSKKKNYKALQLAVVEAVGGIDDIRNELDDTVIEIDRETVAVEGQIEDINEVYSRVYEKINALVSEDSPSHKYSYDCVQFINNHGNIIQKINDALEAAGMTVKWELRRNELAIYFPRGYEPKKVSQLILGKIAETKIDLDRAMSTVLRSDEWMSFSQDQTEAFTDVRHDHVDRAMVVYGYAESVTVVVDNINTFLEDNAVRSLTIKVEQDKVEFMDRYRHESKKIMDIEKKYDQYNVCIELKKTQGSIEVTGKKKGREESKKDLEKLANEITSEKYEIKKIDVQSVFVNEQQKGTIKTIEKETCCLIKSPFDQVSTPVYSSKFTWDSSNTTIDGATGGYKSPEEVNEAVEDPTDSRMYKCKNGIIIKQMEGEIGRESADVLAATCDRNLDLKLGGASRSLLTCAGAELQAELSNNHKEVGHAELVKLESYKLECSKVFLTSLPNWSPHGGCMQLVQKFMTECLKALAAMRKRSIIFTAMGTGQLNFPADQVAQVMYQTVIEFDKSSPNTSVEEVEFIMYHKDGATIRAFRDELKALKEGGRTQQTYAIQMTNIHVEIVIEDIAAQKVDAILCSSSDNFDLSKSGAVAALLKVGGKALQDGASAYKQTGLSKGQVSKIAAVGNLPCKAVFLTVLPSYSQDNASALSDSIKAFLNSCHMEKMTSVAMPAMGSGFLKYPKPFVSRTMIEAVQQWAANTPNSSIKSVRFVMYAKDYEVINAFKAKIRSLQGSSVRKGRQLERSMSKDGDSSKKYSMFDSGCNIGHVSLTVKAGDIVTEKADAIVSSIARPCEFLGAVSQSLVKKCPNMRKTVEKKKSRLEKNGVITTDTEGGIPAGKVIHIHFQDRLDDWQKYFCKCLEKANDKKLKSLAFPVLGTGQGSKQFQPQDIAGALFDAINEFVFKSKPRLNKLKDVRLVIFHKQQAMKDPIMKALSQKVNDCIKGSKGFFGKMKGVFTGMKDKFLGPSKQPIPQTKLDEASSVVVTIYSDNKGNIDNCKKELERRLDANYIKKRIDNYTEIVKELSQEELSSIENTPGLIDITVDKPKGIITLYGPSRTVSNVDSEIQQKLRKIERDKRTAKEAQTLYELVKWHHEDITPVTINLVPYGEAVNLTIENAYKDNQPSIRLQDTSGDVYIIDFVKMVEYPENDPNDEVNVIRKDIIKGGDANLPKEWVPMADGENIKVVNLTLTDKEYKTVESTFVKGVQNGGFKDRIPNVAGLKVTKIERIQNKTLYQQYVAKKKQMQGEKPQLPANMPLERTLWHGTAQAAVGSIQRHGFNRSYSGKNGTWYGAGVYFASDASYSARPWLAIGQQNPPNPPGQNKGYIFMCKVLTGQYTLGNNTMRYLPPVDANKSKTLMYDSAVNNLVNPVEFVIFHDTQAYPEYIITFTL